MEGRKDWTKKQIELIEEIRRISEQIGEVPTREMLKQHPEWPNPGTIVYHFGSYTALKEAADLPTTKNVRHYGMKQMMRMLTSFILAMGRVPSQLEVRLDPTLPSDAVYLSIYPDWETVIAEAGFEMSWCSPQMRQKLSDDLWRKYAEIGYRPPLLLDIQNDATMEKVFVYVQIFGDLRSAVVATGIWDDYCRRTRREITETVIRISKELGRTPNASDPGMPNGKLVKQVFRMSYPEAIRSMGLEPNYRLYTKEILIGQLRDKFYELGERSPMAKEIEADPKMASMQTFRKVFGTHAKALKAARLPPLSARK